MLIYILKSKCQLMQVISCLISWCFVLGLMLTCLGWSGVECSSMFTYCILFQHVRCQLFQLHPLCKRFFRTCALCIIFYHFQIYIAGSSTCWDHGVLNVYIKWQVAAHLLLQSVLITSSGAWKLGGFGFAISIDPSSGDFSNVHAFHYSVSEKNVVLGKTISSI